MNVGGADLLRKQLDEIDNLAKLRNKLAHNPLEIATVVDGKTDEIVHSSAMIRGSKTNEDMMVDVADIETGAERARTLYGEILQAINQAQS